jgi:hypothetical protein
LQFFLPVQNCAAKANLGADRSLLEQERMRVTQLEADVAAEVRNAITALDAAQENFQAGYGTNLAVIEQGDISRTGTDYRGHDQGCVDEGCLPTGPCAGTDPGENGISVKDETAARQR